MNIDIRTPFEVRREKRDNRICAMYSLLTDNYPTLTHARKVNAISSKFDLGRKGIESCLIRKGMYTRESR